MQGRLISPYSSKTTTLTKASAPSRRRDVALLLLLLGVLTAILPGCGSGGSQSRPAPLQITTTSPLPSAQTGVAYSEMLVATGGTTPYHWSVGSGNLPSGVTLSSSGLLSGTPSAFGSFSFAAKVTDAGDPSQMQSASFTLSVDQNPTITSAGSATFRVGSAGSFTVTATGYPAPSLSESGALPSGVGFNSSTGVLSGTPGLGTDGSYLLTFTASNGVGVDSVQDFTLTVNSAIPVTVSVSPRRAGLTVTQTLSITATTTDGAGVDWSAVGAGCSGNGCGVFSTTKTASGVAVTYTAPSAAGVYTVTATSVTNISASASLTVGVTSLSGVTTYHNDLYRDGANAQEYALTASNVTSGSFGKLFSCIVDGAVYAQPLWIANSDLSGTRHNVVFVATQHDSLYAFDADTSPCIQLWHVSLIDSPHGGTAGEIPVPSSGSGSLVGSGSGDIAPEVGVTGTPVIDLSSDTLYVVSKSVVTSGPTFYQRLHAIDLFTGTEKFSGPVNIAATYPGTGDGGTTTTFNPGQQNQRPGLALVNGTVYIAWASHGDASPYYGWVIGYNASDLTQQTAVLNVTPNVRYGGIWMGGGAPSADSSNNLYLITGNGTFDATSATTPNNDYGDSFLKLGNNLSVADYFTPSDQASDNANDADFGSGGAAILVDQPASPKPHLVIGGGKDGYLYLLDRDNMGKFGDPNAWQRFNFGNPIFATGAFWNGRYYLAGVNGPLQSYLFDTVHGKLDTGSVIQSSSPFGFPGSTPSVSSSGVNNGIVWALDNGSYCTSQSWGCGPAVLHAYDATNVANELWNSTQGSGNASGYAVKFTVPTVANGKVYVGTRGNNTGGGTSSSTIPGELDVYGLLP
jgi:hypothetical protein